MTEKDESGCPGAAAGRDFVAEQLSSSANVEEAAVTRPPIASAASGHNRRVLARDLLRRAPQHERLHIDADDHDAAALRAAEPWNWRPFPVVVIEGVMHSVDGTVLLPAIVEQDWNALVEYEIVDDEEALRIRSMNNAQRARREPMAMARRALILSAQGRSHADVAKELRLGQEPELTVARISQLIKAAKTEAALPGLAEVVEQPSRIPVRFWDAIAKKISTLHALDIAEPVPGESRVIQFCMTIEAFVTDRKQRQEKIAYSECLTELKLKRASEPQKRARHLGKKHRVPGTGEHIGFAPERAGGAAISLPQTLSEKEARLVFEAVRAHVADLLVGRQLSARTQRESNRQ